MEGRLDSQRSEFIAQVCRNNSWFDAPLEERGIGRDEWERFLDYAVEAATIRDNKERSMVDGSVEVEMTFMSHSGKVGQEDEKWNVNIPHKHTDKVLAVGGMGKVIATLIPAELTTPIDGQMSFDFDEETGEVF